MRDQPVDIRVAMQKSMRNTGLDVARAAAIALVLITHYSKVAPVCGVLGVELFFVLSGFLIGGILYRTIQHEEQFNLVDLMRFWVRRWMRTLPNYYLFLLVFTLYTNAFTFRPVHWYELRQYSVFLQNFAWPVPEFYGISWSLAVEEWFYLLFPLGFYLIYSLLGKHRSIRRMSFITSIVCFFAFSMISRFWHGTSFGWSLGMRMIVIYRFDALMFGVILSVVKHDSALLWHRLEQAYPYGIVLLAIGTFVASNAFPVAVPIIPAAWIFTILPMAFALILPALTNFRSTSVCFTTIIRKISESSYSVYLCHWPILWVLMRMIDDSSRGLAAKVSIRLLALGCTFATATVLYRCFEQPILSLAPVDKYSPMRRSSSGNPDASLAGDSE